MTISSIARRLNFTAGVPPWLPPLILVTDETRLADPLPVLNSLPPGTGVLLRHYETPHRLELAQEIASICRRNRLLFLLAGDADLAFTVNADGLHLPDYMVRNPPLTARIWRRHPGKLVTAAAHSRFSLLKAGELGADAALLSPVFPTKSHPSRTALGSTRFTAWVRSGPLPVYALGGLSAKNGSRLFGTGAIGIAGISGIDAEFYSGDFAGEAK